MPILNKKYKNSPLIEVVCEFWFDLDNPNDATIPGILYGDIKDKFPVRKQRNFGAALPIDGKENEKEFILSPLAQFFNPEENQLVQVGNNLLTINALKPYPTWEKFKPTIVEIFKKYVAVVKPKSIQRIGLRAINKIHIPSVEFKISDYFVFSPTFPENHRGQVISNFNIQIERELNEKRDLILIKNHTTVPEVKDNTAVMLDIDYVMKKKGGININEKDVNEWLENAHAEIYSTFDNSIKKQLKELFDK
jgi:uncharacterized protein (TIGR04255 family)